MGGMFDSVEGKTKVGTWIAFKTEMKRLRDDSDDRTYIGGMQLIFPTSKKEAFARMERNHDDSGWILWYRLHS